MNEAAPSRRCSKCGQDKPVSEFYTHRLGRDGLRSECKLCTAEQNSRWRAANLEKARERGRERARQWREANPEMARERDRRPRKRDPERAREHARRWSEANPERARESKRRSHEANREKVREQARRWYEAQREKVFAHYGTSCACCGSTERLCIDHVNGDGRQHREELFGNNKRTRGIYRWLIKNGFPPGYQTLCIPCNTSKGTGERCRMTHGLVVT